MRFAIRSVRRFWWCEEERLGRLEYLIGSAATAALTFGIILGIRHPSFPGDNLAFRGIAVAAILTIGYRCFVSTKRRLHDAGLCTWWMLAALPSMASITLHVGWLDLIVRGLQRFAALFWAWLLFTPSVPEPNAYGDPVRDPPVPGWLLIGFYLLLFHWPFRPLYVFHRAPAQTERLHCTTYRVPSANGEEQLAMTIMRTHSGDREGCTASTVLRPFAPDTEWSTEDDGWTFTLTPSGPDRYTSRIIAPEGWMPHTATLEDITLLAVSHSATFRKTKRSKPSNKPKANGM